VNDQMRIICADERLIDSLVMGSNLRRPSPKYCTAIGMSLFNIAQFSTGLLSSAPGIVPKRRDRPYRSGRSPDWIKVKNPDAPAATRVIE
jgi:hypothetical protein